MCDEMSWLHVAYHFEVNFVKLDFVWKGVSLCEMNKGKMHKSKVIDWVISCVNHILLSDVNSHEWFRIKWVWYNFKL